MPTLDIYLNETHVGQLSQNEQGQLSFSYLDSYWQAPRVARLSIHLPLGPGGFNDEDSRAFFSNLLPEDTVLEQIAQRLGLSKGNTFGILEKIGGDCAGAVSVLPKGKEPATKGSYRKVTPKGLSTILSELPTHPMLADDEEIRLSLAGAQNKFPILYDGAEFLIPEGEAPSSHILKTQINHIRNLENTVVNEAFCMKLADAINLPVSSVEVVEIGGKQVYMIERYDRLRLNDGDMTRLHQEDFCQALGVVPVLKYESEGGPGFRDVFTLVREHSDEPLTDSDALLSWTLYNFLVGNADGHGKNLSFLYSNGLTRLAPFYDILSTAAYEGKVNNKFAMCFGHQKDPRYLSLSNLEGFAQQVGIGKRIIFTELRDMVDKIERERKQLVENFSGDARNRIIVSRINHVIDDRIKKTKYLLQGVK